MGQLFEALADLHHRHHRQHSRNGHQDDEHHCDTHDLSLDRQPDHGAILFKEWPSLRSFRRFHPTAPGAPPCVWGRIGNAVSGRYPLRPWLLVAPDVAVSADEVVERRYLVQHMSLDLALNGPGARTGLMSAVGG